ncbi:hypothetical protein Fcan01_17630 [Folsomia candida]|uniref:Uncharacterized protein n=1 Tax=Folsomia candida TaxID=158441 RepID=A0A226DPZ0_FOLCA|nr:hypothetical protein Fcan01_17630 [Folsomia candida]
MPILLLATNLFPSYTICGFIPETVPIKLEILMSYELDITGYLKSFENCISIIYTPPNISVRTFQSRNFLPIMLLTYSPNKTSVTGKLIGKTFSMQRRRNQSLNCWATFAILPEKEPTFNFKYTYYSFVSKSCFIETHFSSQYFVWVTNTKSFIKRDITKVNYGDSFSLREVIILDVNRLIGTLAMLHLQMEYYNIYHLSKPITGISATVEWYEIEGFPSDCFHQLNLLVKNVSRLNKYFWVAGGTFSQDIPDIRKLYGRIDFKSMQLSRKGYHNVALLTNFNGFVAFGLLQDVLHYDYKSLSPHHLVPPIQRLPRPSNTWPRFSFVPYDVQKFSFVSCYKVRSTYSTLTALTSPFDWEIWLFLVICFISISIILTILRKRLSSDGMLLIIGISLENSVLSSLSIYDLKKLSCNLDLPRIRAIIGIWTILVGTILTNWYKTYFTMEMIVPTKYESPWKSVMDVEDIQVLMPFNLLDEFESNLYKFIGFVLHGDFFRHQQFFSEILVRSEPIAKGYVGYKRNVVFQKMARRLVKIIIPYFGIGTDGRYYRNGTFSMYEFKFNQPLYNKSTLSESPLQPVSYRERDNKVVKRLSTCGKVALMDTKENIAAITAFLNDNSENIKYLRGEDTYFTAIRGWPIPPVRNSYVEQRLKLMITSGIFSHWETLYKLWKPVKVLGHYANWTHPRFDAVSKLDFNSKVITGFYIGGICLAICSFTFVLEFCWFNDSFNRRSLIICSSSFRSLSVEEADFERPGDFLPETSFRHH